MSIDWHPNRIENASDEYLLHRAAMLEHLARRYAALSPEIEYESPTAADYDLDDFEDEVVSHEFDVPLEEYPGNVQALAESLGYREEDFNTWDLFPVLDDLHLQVTDEAARLKVLKDDYELSREVEDAITDAFSYIVSIEDPDARTLSAREVREEWDEDMKKVHEHLGGGPVTELDGLFVPLTEEIMDQYEMLKEMKRKEFNVVSSGIPNLKFFYDQ